MDKKCRHCGEVKDASDGFYKSSGNSCKECVKKRSRRVYRENKNNPDYIPGESKRRWSQSAHEKTHSLIKASSKKRGLALDLTVDDMKEIVYLPCHYCGQIDTREWRKNMFSQVNSIDRVDASIGYVHGNCVPCCAMCNIMKHIYSKDDFIAKAKQIAEHNKNNEE